MADTEKIDRALADIRAQLADISARLQRLESLPGGAPARTTEAAHSTDEQTASHSAELPAEIVLIISAAVAAYLGERAHVRQIRLAGSREWAQQGRVSIQASHMLHPHR